MHVKFVFIFLSTNQVLTTIITDPQLPHSKQQTINQLSKMPNTQNKTKAPLLAAAAATAVNEKLLSKEQTGPPCEERSVMLPMEQPKLLCKEQSVPLSKELDALVE
jgi:hypothetical protein